MSGWLPEGVTQDEIDAVYADEIEDCDHGPGSWGCAECCPAQAEDLPPLDDSDVPF